MSIIAIAALGCGVGLVVAQIVVSMVAGIKAASAAAGGPAISEAVSETLKALADKVPLAVAGIVLILIAAIVNGDLAASVVFGDPSPAPSST
ncbi:hypothetical protein GCM10009775_37020 [Microbacterium aoyamense]|uniref:Uncharacterized protein n=1 Tax=Microbacterium aoyamense TaxID=344166 RepID=A0ABN2Q2D2_9MICO|nr:hypothetical protein [Microbacterium aoyamense]